MKQKYTLAGILLIAVVLFFVWQKKGGKDKPAFEEVTVTRETLTTTILSTGLVAPENRLDIKPPLSGRVEKILVKEGDKVKRGNILFWMSSTERAALLDAARARGEGEMKKWEDFYKPTPVLAPINGTIILRSIEEGQTFTSQDSVMVLSDRLTIKAQVDETDIAAIHLKQRADIELDAYPGETIPGEVDQIAYDAKTVNNVTTYTIDVLPQTTPPSMRSGMTANVQFFTETKENVLTLPAAAIKSKEGKSLVMVTPKKEKEIVTGLSDGKRVEIVSGLNEGEKVWMPQFKGNKPGAASPLSPFGGGRPRGR